MLHKWSGGRLRPMPLYFSHRPARGIQGWRDADGVYARAGPAGPLLQALELVFSRSVGRSDKLTQNTKPGIIDLRKANDPGSGNRKTIDLLATKATAQKNYRAQPAGEHAHHAGFRGRG